MMNVQTSGLLKEDSQIIAGLLRLRTCRDVLIDQKRKISQKFKTYL